MKIFLPVAFGLSWLVALPLWLGGGLASPYFRLLGIAMMFTPSLGVLAVWLRSRTPFRQWARETGLTLGPRPGRAVLVGLSAWLGTVVLVLVAGALSAAVGLVTLDLHDFATFRAVLASQGVPVPANMGAIVAIQVVSAILTAPIVGALPSLGEEWGWRGWLLPTLVRSRGLFWGLVLSGVIWGLWHAPLTLLGYNYPNLGPWAAAYFVVTCVFIGFLFGWLRLRTGSVWPSVIAHATLNGTVPLIFLFATKPNLALAGLTGVVGWVLMGLTALALYRFLPVRQASPEGGADHEAAGRGDLDQRAEHVAGHAAEPAPGMPEQQQ
ncbi:CPBP family intramembrane glutamic endopeptidase [Nonomuraea sediminis]|uniref:CPBP family intramembrane glutamic endopeptidase n=1 Tax=Nonomuraea sediminis TaxID=2835864 RepID=UPI001BDCD793|nr:CPBP family intramembrane glutamic endopeptidase [Nonomuraea sediminis]